MKKCPTCNRTFEDTLTFCLVDGSVLSPPYDPETTQHLSALIPNMPPTQEEPSQPTIASPIPPQIAPFNSTLLAESNHKSNWRLWIVVGIVASLIIGMIVLTATYKPNEVNQDRSNLNSNAVNTNSDSTPNISSSSSNQINQNTLSSSNNNFRSGNINVSKSNSNMSNTISNISSNSPNTLNQNASLPAEANKTQELDYSKVFSPKEVDQKARILSRPEPTYTEEARQNKVAGTIVLRMVFSASGQVTNITAVSALPYGLTERALVAARQIKFAPAIKDGRAVSQYMQVEYNFNLY
jgi:TonB family protein